jgi:hypothetical protein
LILRATITQSVKLYASGTLPVSPALNGFSHLDLDAGASLGILADPQQKGRAKQDDSDVASEDKVEERMARFERH